MSPTAPIIRLESLTKTFPSGDSEVRALRGVELQVESGQLVAITGASGSGKSTALNILGTLDRPTSGHYFLDGQPVERLEDEELAKIRNAKLGFVFQSFNLLPHDSALDNVELPLSYAGVSRRERRQRSLEALDQVGLGDRIGHRPNQLSGGQQQRVAIARAIVNRPKLLLADEPTGALDSTTTTQILELLGQLHAQGMTVVLVTHDPRVADFAQRVVEFSDGEILSDSRRTAA